MLWLIDEPVTLFTTHSFSDFFRDLHYCATYLPGSLVLMGKLYSIYLDFGYVFYVPFLVIYSLIPISLPWFISI